MLGFATHHHEPATGTESPPRVLSSPPSGLPPGPSALAPSAGSGRASSRVGPARAPSFTFGKVRGCVTGVRPAVAFKPPASPVASRRQLTRKPAAPSRGPCGKFKPLTGLPSAAHLLVAPSLRPLVALLGRRLAPSRGPHRLTSPFGFSGACMAASVLIYKPHVRCGPSPSVKRPKPDTDVRLEYT